MRYPWSILALALVGCGPKEPPVASGETPPPAEESTMNPEAVAGVEHAGFKALLHDDWERAMARWPTWATMLGDRRYDDRLPVNTAEARASDLAHARQMIERGRALPADELSAADQTTLALFLERHEATVREQVCALDTWNLSPRGNALVGASRLPDIHPVHTPDDARNLLSRYREVPRTFDEHIESLREGLQAGRAANATSVRLTLQMLAEQLQLPIERWAMLEPGREEREGWPEGELEAFRAELAQVVGDEVRPAVERYRAFLNDELLAHARPADQEGLWALPEGEACYEALVQRYTTLPVSAAELHQAGLDDLESIHAEMAELGERLFDTRDLPEIFERLRTDPELYFTSSDEIEQTARDAVAAAADVMPHYFGRLPQAPCEVRPVPEYEAPYTTIAYYQRPAVDGTRPGIYYVNTYAPETRPRYEAEVLAYHEAIPGHHLQIAIAQELPELPAFRRYAGMTVYIEGWALYTERLADEMGLYSTDLDRMGMLSFDSWRAARLVVDTGLHAKGWSREQAEAFMLENTPLAENNIRNEVDRYITTPGQALAYKTGKMAIQRLRAEAEEALGTDFELAAFHDVVLGGGAVSLPVLEERVREWIARSAP